LPLKILIIIALGLGFLYGLFTVGLPFLLAMVTAIFLEPLIQLMSKYIRLNRMWSSVIVCSLFMFMLILIMYLLGAKVVTELTALWKVAPAYMDNLYVIANDMSARLEVYFESLSPEIAEQLRLSLEQGTAMLVDTLKGLISGISKSFFDFAKRVPILFVFFIVYSVAVYLCCFSLPGLKQSFLRMFEEKSRLQVDHVLQSLRDSIFGFLRAQLIISLLTYCVTLVGLLIIGVNYPLAIALLIIVVDVLPILGTGAVIIPWSIYSMITNDYFTGIGLFILWGVIVVFRRVVEPKIIGESVGISALAALASLYIGFQLVGVIGLFLGPIVVIIYSAMRKVGLLKFKIKLE
jgi:sporulation integral membrane protein YtvI